MAVSTCPECNADIGQMSSAELQAHRQSHWEGDIPFPNVNKLAVERSSALDDEVIQRQNQERTREARRTLGKDS